MPRCDCTQYICEMRESRSTKKKKHSQKPNYCYSFGEDERSRLSDQVDLIKNSQMSERGFIEMMLTQRKRKGQTNDDQTSRLERERERVAEWHPGVIREDHQKVPNGQTCV